MLPDFPKSRLELAEYLMLKLYSLVQQKEPIFGEISGITQHEGDIIAYDQMMENGVRIVSEGFREGRTEIITSIADIPELVGAKLDAKLDGIAEDMARQFADHFREKLDTATREVGNAFDGGGTPLSKEIFLGMMERMQMDFDPITRQPEFIFWAHPKMAEALRATWAEWTKDRAFMQKHADLLSRKYEEFRDRESHRKLVD
jgi:hypothetical protein